MNCVHVFVGSASGLPAQLSTCYTVARLLMPNTGPAGCARVCTSRSRSTAAAALLNRCLALLQHAWPVWAVCRTLVTSWSIWFLLSCLIMDPKGRAVPADRDTHHGRQVCTAAAGSPVQLQLCQCDHFGKGEHGPSVRLQQWLCFKWDLVAQLSAEAQALVSNSSCCQCDTRFPT